MKHFIPHHAITCAVRAEKPNDDVVSCILLIYNPATACPVHVHSYRCDSSETAGLLLDQLNTLTSRPDNQKKFQEIEARLAEKGLLQRNSSSAGSSKVTSHNMQSDSLDHYVTVCCCSSGRTGGRWAAARTAGRAATRGASSTRASGWRGCTTAWRPS